MQNVEKHYNTFEGTVYNEPGQPGIMISQWVMGLYRLLVGTIKLYFQQMVNDLSDWIYILLLTNAFSYLETYLAPFRINFWAARDSHFPGCFPGSVLLVLSSSFCLPDTAISNNINCQLIYFWSAAPVSNYPCEMVYASEKVFLVVYPLI